MAVSCGIRLRSSPPSGLDRPAFGPLHEADDHLGLGVGVSDSIVAPAAGCLELRSKVCVGEQIRRRPCRIVGDDLDRILGTLGPGWYLIAWPHHGKCAVE